MRWTQQRKKKEEQVETETIDEIPNETIKEIKKMSDIAGYVYIFAALANALLPNVFRWDNDARSALYEVPSLWLFWLPIIVSFWCKGMLPADDNYLSSQKIREYIGDSFIILMPAIPCLAIFIWMFIEGVTVSDELTVGGSAFFQLFTGPVICVIAWCIGLYFVFRMQHMANSVE